MTDPYRLTDASEPPRQASSGGGAVRPILWGLLVISATANTIGSLVNVYLGVVFGVLALSCVAALVVHHRRHRRG